MNTTYLNFGDFLQKKRMERQITLRKMAELLGFSAPYLTDIEKDRRNPPEMESLEQISKILNLSECCRTRSSRIYYRERLCCRRPSHRKRS